jgi:hypothetical protein
LKSKPKTSDNVSPLGTRGERGSIVDNLMMPSFEENYNQQQDFNKSYWQPNMEFAKSREGSPISGRSDNSRENETLKAFNGEKKAATAARVAELHTEFNMKCKEIKNEMIQKIYNSANNGNYQIGERNNRNKRVIIGQTNGSEVNKLFQEVDKNFDLVGDYEEFQATYDKARGISMGSQRKPDMP